MKVLFVVTGNKGRLSFVFANQLASLKDELAEYKLYLVQGKGVWGYLKNLFPLVREIRRFRPDLIHAHYSLCGYLAALTGFRRVVVSLMGSDCRSHSSVLLVRFFHSLFWSYSIVKSKEMQHILKLKQRVDLIPNGVDLEKFEFISKAEACRQVGFDAACKNVTFIANPTRPEKNYPLAENAVSLLKISNVKLNIVFEIPHEQIRHYLYASDALLLTSLHEGSPNVIKEAMACELPIVSTDVGDVKSNISGLSGCYVTGFNASEIADALSQALMHEGPTGGRERLLQLGLDALTVKDKVIGVYQKTLTI